MLSPGDQLEYSASLLDMPDLPNWMFCHHPENSSDAFLYGSAEDSGLVEIEIVALNKNTYETSRKIMKLEVEPRSSVAQYEVEMKFLNLNVDDMFRSDRLNRLVEVFKGNLWKDSSEIYITKVVSSLDVGGRLPLNPNEKEGVVVRIGGIYVFSRDLEDLEREVQPLRNRSPCPRDYKRTSVERLFRSRNFVADWCSFRLLSGLNQGKSESSHGWSDNPYSSISLTSDDYAPPYSSLPRRDFVFDFVVSIVIPSAIVGILSSALTCIMCCSRDRVEKKGDSNSLQMDHYSTLQHASVKASRLSVKRNSLPESASTPASSFPCSNANSPSVTLSKGCTLRSSSRTGTTRGIMIPPPPPYTPTRQVSHSHIFLKN
ncbi:epsilon-sarcoglycan-like [Uloborus diversus]|uniref:epsilon-sarcoglycan-like n=1 Tax=Uloborus diversus TaxID=327109 RepID=UPI0024098140|nr:epsilon-sarcoglycan-like [Uloborus diversus]